MKKTLLALLFICALFFVGCATTKDTEVFRFEIRELKLTLYATQDNKSKDLKLIRGEAEKNATIVYTVTYVNGDKAGTIDMNNGIISVQGSGTNDKGYATTKGVDDIVKVTPLSEGVVRFSAFVEGRENVADSIIITVEKESMNGFQLKAKSGFYYDEKDDQKKEPIVYLNCTATFDTSTLPSYLDKKVLRYEVSDETIATVSETGTIKGLALGSVTVKAYSEYDPTFYSMLNIKVTYAPAGKILISNEEEYLSDKEDLTNGDVVNIFTEVEAKTSGISKDSVNQNVTIKSSNESVLVVEKDEEGNVSIKAIAGGKANLVVETEDKKVKKEIEYTVSWPKTEELNLSSYELTIKKGKDASPERTEVKPENACPDLEISFKKESEENDSKYIAIDGNKIIGKEVTDSPITLIVKTIESGTNVPIEKEINVTVVYDDITGVSFATKAFTVTTGDSSFKDGVLETQLKWSVSPNGADPSVQFESSDETIATVDEKGKLTILDKVGTATITVTSKVNAELKDEFVVTVTPKAESFTVEWPEDERHVFTYSDDLEIVITVNILPEAASQDTFNVEIDNKGNCYVDYDKDGNKIILVLDPDSLGEFEVIINVPGVDGEQFRSYSIVAPAENED